MKKLDKVIRIEEGKHYQRRDGLRVGPMLKSISGSHPFYPEGKAETYMENGRWLNEYSKMPDDLVREVPNNAKTRIKRGPKPGNRKKLTVAVSIDIKLKADIDARTENVSNFLNEAGKAYLPKWDKKARP